VKGAALSERGGAEIHIRVPERLKLMGADMASASGEALSLDPLDGQLIAHLMGDGRLGNRALAAMVGVSEVTVGSRLRRLVKDNVLVFTAIVDWEAAGYDWFVIARVTVVGRDRHEVARDLGDVPGCIASSVVYGRADAVAFFLVEDRAGLQSTLGERLARIPGLARVDVDLALTSSVTLLGQATFLATGVDDLHLPAPVVSMDALDVAVVELLLEDGRQSSRRIGRALSVSEGTVRARMARLLDAGLVKIVAMVNPLAVGMAGVIANLTLQVRLDMLDDVAGKLAAVGEIVLVATTVGSGEVVAVAAAADHERLVELIQGDVRGLDGVTDVDVLEMTEVVRFNPFLKRFGPA
jgi:DNA-binding Lrp family transcriptional regulator